MGANIAVLGCRVGMAMLLAGTVTMAQGAAPNPAATANPALWPTLQHQVRRDPRIESRIDTLMAGMSVEDKVGQLLQVDILNVQPADLLTYKLGSVLNGGTSGPYGDDKAPPAKWLQLADEYYDAMMTRTDGRPKIPLIWGTDAVHGNNNVPGATLFPHNIGLGATRNRDLIRRIGEITGLETMTAGQEWTFAPTVAVARDDRWGRTYESYSEDPAIVESFAGAVVEGLQGRGGTRDFLASNRVVASTKHFLADGGTEGGRDQGDARFSEQELMEVHAAGYKSAVAAGTQTIMVSFSSWHGVKMTANRSLLTDVLKGRMGFDGFLVSDWNAHTQLPGCTINSCPSAINAGLDMFMYSGNGWRQLYDNTLAQVKTGEIPQARVDDAVRRILRVKLRAGLFEAGRPSTRPQAGKFELLGAPAHRAIARQAVRESLVLLKNDGVLPIRAGARVLVAGVADSITQAAGGWSISWQGGDMANSDFPNGQSIWGGIEAAVKAGGGRATLSARGEYTEKPEVAIVVFGEKPYAEGVGDRPTLEFSPADKSDVALLRRLRAEGIPVVSVFLSGRPLWVNAEINASNAFVAAFLPGTEGGGVADVLVRKPDGEVHHDFKGKLSFSWPRRPDQYVLHRGQADYDPLFAFGYGLSYAQPAQVSQLNEERPVGIALGDAGPIFGRGRLLDNWSLTLVGAPGQFGNETRAITGASGALRSNTLAVRGVDRRVQEDSRAFTWSGRGIAEARFETARPIDLSAPLRAGEALIVEYRVDTAPTGDVQLVMANGLVQRVALPVTTALREATPGEWRTLSIPLQCHVARGLDPVRVSSPFILETTGSLALTISDIRIGPSEGAALSCS